MQNSPLLGICTGPDQKEVVQQAGAEFIEVNVQGFLVPRQDDAVFAPNRETASKLGLPIPSANMFLPKDLPCVGPAVDEPALLAYAERAFARAQIVGIETIVFGSGGARQIPAGFPLGQAREQFVDLLKKIAPLAERSSVMVVIEPLNVGECNFINTLADGAEMVEACGHPSVQLLADTYHMGFSGEGPETVREFGQSLRHFHIAEYPSRHFPGAEGANHRAYFEVLREIGYLGRISLECKWVNFADEAAQGIANVRRDLVAAGYGEAAGAA